MKLLFLHQYYTWVSPLYYQDLVLDGMVIELVKVDVGQMGVEVVGVEPIEEHDLDVEEMKVESAGIVGKQKIVGKKLGRLADMFGFHEHILANFEQVGFGLVEETKYAKAQVHSMNFKQYIDNLKKIVAQLVG